MPRRARVLALLLLLVAISSAAALPRTGAGREGAPRALAPTAGPPEAGDDLLASGRPSLRVFTDRDGLPQNAVGSAVFDHDGFLWIGTKDGAARFDGRAWTVVNMPPEVHSNWVVTILVASDGSLWFGTQHGLAHLIGERWEVYDESDGLPGPEVTSLLEAPSPGGRPALWVGTQTGLVRLEDGRWIRELPLPDTPDAPVTSLYQASAPDGHRAIWGAVPFRGFVRLRDGAWKFFGESEGFPHNTLGMCFAETTAIDGKPTLLAGGFVCGLMRFDGASWSALPGLNVGNVFAAKETRAADGTPTLWIGQGEELDKVERGRLTRVTARQGLPEHISVWCLAPIDSPSGALGIWAGTSGLGAVCLRFGGWTSFDKSSGLPGESIYSILSTTEDDGSHSLWIGTIANGLCRLNRGTWTSFAANGACPASTIWTLAEAPDFDGRKAIWAGTNMQGLFRFKDGVWTHFGRETGLHSEVVGTLRATTAADGSPALLIGTVDGLFQLDHGRVHAVAEPTIGNVNVTAILETAARDGAKTLWLGTGRGLARFANGSTTTIGTGSGLPNDAITSLHERISEDGTHLLWVGTRGGVALIDLDDPGAPMTYLSTATTPALPNDTIYRIEEDARRRVYVFTNKGVARLTPRAPTPDDASHFSVYTFTTLDGLPSNECNTGASTVDADGRVWAGTIAGVAVFDPTREVEDLSPKPLAIERASLPDHGRDLVGGASLRYNENHVRFEFALLSYFRGDDTRYRTQLVGYDDEPSDWATDVTKDYISLPAGTYRFAVWGRDALGNVSGPVEVPFTIRSAPWLTWWAACLYAAAAFALFYAAFRLRVRALHHRTELLERRIAERTTELARTVEDLRASEQRASDANRAKSVFLANMSHELRTPLNAILGFVQLMERDGTLSRSHHESLGIISRSGEHLLGLINDVLSISKIEAGKQALVEQTFDLHALLRAVTEMVRAGADAKRLEVELAVDPRVPVVVTGDEGKLRQVLVNLLGNAVKFTDAGGVALRARWEDAGAGARGRAVFEVADTGYGMTAEEIAQLFESFMQTESGRRAREGTGLGLVISRDFVRLMGGDMRVASEPGAGTTFTFDVPLGVASESDRRVETRRRAVALAPDSPAWRVLVVDDTAENRLLLTQFLESLGLDVREGANGAEAVELWRAWRPHLIWMDMRMPVMDGLEATRRIRELEAAENGAANRCRIVALTASAFEHDRDRFLEAGCDDFVPKPFQTSTIVEKLAEHVGMRFEYDGGSAASGRAEEEKASPTAAMSDRLGAVPAPLLASLKTALDVGDIEAALETAERVREIDAPLADDLASHIRAYRFDELIASIEGAGSGSVAT